METLRSAFKSPSERPTPLVLEFAVALPPRHKGALEIATSTTLPAVPHVTPCIDPVQGAGVGDSEALTVSTHQNWICKISPWLTTWLTTSSPWLTTSRSKP